jgi:hypothetical protein
MVGTARHPLFFQYPDRPFATLKVTKANKPADLIIAVFKHRGGAKAPIG